MTNKILLVVLDGFGWSPDSYFNAGSSSTTPFLHSLYQKFSGIKINAAGKAVGLPQGQIGNSEVGHIHIGAGRKIYSSLVEINRAIKSNKLKTNSGLQKASNYCLEHKSSFHFLGLLSNGGVHSHEDHMFALYKIVATFPIKKFYFHLICDGRDTKPAVFKGSLAKLQSLIKNDSRAMIASVGGRYYTMDRDQRFSRTKQGFQAIVNAQGQTFTDSATYIQASYDKNCRDEFVKPACHKNYKGFCDYDVCFFTNFRADRAIQFSSMLSNKNYLFQAPFTAKKIFLLTMKKYSESVLETAVCFPKQKIEDPLGVWLSKNKRRQLRVAETEKIAHVTYFFDGGCDYFKNGTAHQKEIKLPQASCLLVASPQVKTYDLVPEMSAFKITNRLISNVKSNLFDFTIVNYANCDMVGHTGVFLAAQQACQSVDACLEQLYQTCQETKTTLIITADHGNCEVMKDADGKINKKHTLNQVPFIVCSTKITLSHDQTWTLANVAPTVLEIIGLAKPPLMTAISMISK